ncbi:MAG: hypothetical protein M0R80_01240 [Proteobacteria bacterium]|jgi:hypothetical protein|nr:hypothetical protein [Pseudomonadota bacterium]
MITFSEFCIKNLAKQAKVDIACLDKKQLEMGVKVEREHNGKMGKDTKVIKNDAEALKIAVAHLREDPKYYTKLKKIEH